MDEKIFHLINEQWTNPVFDLFMPAISYSDIWTPFFTTPVIRPATAAERARSGASLPSGHTNNNGVIALCCTIFYRRWGKLYWIIAAAVAYSRISLGAQWPSDVFATLFLATGGTL